MNHDKVIEMMRCAEYNLETNYPKLGSVIVAPVVMQIKEAIKMLEAMDATPATTSEPDSEHTKELELKPASR